jgi:hypothetical protein
MYYLLNFIYDFLKLQYKSLNLMNHISFIFQVIQYYLFVEEFLDAKTIKGLE